MVRPATCTHAACAAVGTAEPAAGTGGDAAEPALLSNRTKAKAHAIK